jgi:hypothetical protein
MNSKETPVMTTLTPEQRELVERAGDDPVRIENPETHEVYIVIKEDVFTRLRKSAAIEHSDPSLFEFEDYKPLK